MSPVCEEELVGESKPVRTLFEAVKHVAPTTTTVVIGGETGVAKEQVDRPVHRSSPPAARPSVVVDCAALHDNLLKNGWPGNVRELIRVIERAVILSDGGTLEPEHLQLAVRRTVPATSREGPTLRDVEIQHILRVLEQHQGNRERAAAALGISQRTLYRRLKETRCSRGGEAGSPPAIHRGVTTRSANRA